MDGGRLQGHVRKIEERTKYIEGKKRARLTSGSRLFVLNLCSFLVLTFLYHSAALHACRAQKGGEDCNDEADDFCPSVLFHGDRGAHPSPSQREGALPLTWVTAACWGFRAIFS